MRRSAVENVVQVQPADESKPVPVVVEHRTLASRIRRTIRRQTSGIAHLKVEVQSTVVRLAGRCSTFYSKQLAQAAVMRLAPGWLIDNQIEVGDWRASR